MLEHCCVLAGVLFSLVLNMDPQLLLCNRPTSNVL